MTETSSESTSADERFAEGLKLARESMGMTQEALALRMRERGFKFHQATIYKIESGFRRVTVGEAAALSRALSVSLPFLISGSDREELYLQHVVQLALDLMALHDEIAEKLEDLRGLENAIRQAVDTREKESAPDAEVYPGLRVSGLVAAVVGIDGEALLNEIRDRIASPVYDQVRRNHGW
ncbi:MAG: helix-turn-helix domain-containing protein [Microcella sp.]